ncbi:MAG: sel1 repeat family protein [Rhodospirillales bacterium]|nr:sel1 repeat family protein [Rhodospirillales bacterium]
MIRTVFYALLCSLLLSLPASADNFFTSKNYWNGKTAYDSGDFEKAMRLWKAPAEQGVGEAQGFVGALYHGGLGVEKDYKQAMEWYVKAANKGIAQAQLGIGSMYGDGHGVEKDMVTARMWFAIADHYGNERAQHYIKKADLLLTEEDIRKAGEMARDWIKAHEK